MTRLASNILLFSRTPLRILLWLTVVQDLWQADAEFEKAPNTLRDSLSTALGAQLGLLAGALDDDTDVGELRIGTILDIKMCMNIKILMICLVFSTPGLVWCFPPNSPPLMALFGIFHQTESPSTAAQAPASSYPNATFVHGGLTRLDSTQPIIYLTFTGGDYNDGKRLVRKVLRRTSVKANFFFTGDFYRKRQNHSFIRYLVREGHYVGAHSDKHLLYAPWENRDSLLVSRSTFTADLEANYTAMANFGITKAKAHFFMPPYEWYNQQISDWTAAMGLQLINFTPGTRSNADYTTPDMGNRYRSSQFILDSILDYEAKHKNGLNGFILLLHVGTHPSRTDKMYRLLPVLIDTLRARGYRLASFHELR